MYTLKSIAKRGALLSAAGALLVAAILPGASAFADALNPLTERSLMLSSSAPGFVDTDGSGNSNSAPNSIGQNYAPAGTGPNGKKTGETLSFKVSSTETIKGFAMQYCTTAAGKCRSPGNNAAGVQNDPAGWAAKTSNLEVKPGFVQGNGAGQFQVYIDGVETTADWEMSVKNVEDQTYTGPDGLTGAMNYIEITSADGQLISNGDEVKIVFKPSETVYITNPGAKAFFVKLNTYDTATKADMVPGNIHNIDGGVTVANVMTDSIHITTKVLETMAFSVGTQNRDMQTLNCDTNFGQPSQPAGCEAASGATHGPCDPIQNINNNRLNLGDPNAEYSLETGKAWDVYSYWRLSSNSSGGATVYYSGNTLANTVGDSIKDVPTETLSTPGKEQFGLGFVAPEEGSAEYKIDNPGVTPDSVPFTTLNTGQTDALKYPVNQTKSVDYNEATGTIDNGTGGAGTAKFKFLQSSLTSPEPIAQQNSVVISCATAKMRYVGNIAADTPAGVYTTKINYLAAPQY
jgi:hypothetical protein